MPESDIADLAAKVRRGGRLSFEDGVRLYRTPDLFTLGRLAHERRRALHGNKTYYVVNRHINYSNVCTDACLFCAFGKRKGQKEGYEFTLKEIVAKAMEAEREGATEIHIVGGLHPDYPYGYYPEMLSAIKAQCPGLHLKAFTAVEIAWIAEVGKKSIAEVLTDLRAAGLGSLPGGGAEIFAPAVRKKICTHKIDADIWADVHRTAHAMGLRSTCTMLYGHIESDEDRVDHMLRLRAIQDEHAGPLKATGEDVDPGRGFTAFIPLAFHPENTFLPKIPKPTANLDLRTIAISRLILDNIPHIKVYWIMVGIELAQVGLGFGADDLDGTVVEEKIYHMAGAQTPQGLRVADLEKVIRDAGGVPVRRDSLYKELATAAG